MKFLCSCFVFSGKKHNPQNFHLDRSSTNPLVFFLQKFANEWINGITLKRCQKEFGKEDRSEDVGVMPFFGNHFQKGHQKAIGKLWQSMISLRISGVYVTRIHLGFAIWEAD